MVDMSSSKYKKLKNIKIKKTLKKNGFEYVYLDKKILANKDIIIVIDNNEYRIDKILRDKYLRIKNILILSIYKKILKIYKYAEKNNIKVKDIYLINYNINETNDELIYELDNILEAYHLPYKKRVNFIYDYMCYYLDEQFEKFNLCDFKENKCISRRNLECKGCEHPLVYGCCYTKGRVCPYLKENRCTINSIACKFFTCRYLRKRGIKFKPNDYLIVKLFFNRRQKSIIYNSIYTPKDIVIKKIMRSKMIKK